MTEIRIDIPGQPVPKKKFGILTCSDCGATVIKSGPSQKYCQKCSAARDLARKKKYAAENPRPAEIDREAGRKRRDRGRDHGAKISKEMARTIGDAHYEPEVSWHASIVVPFTYNASKNAIYVRGKGGHVAIRKQVSAFRDDVAFRLRAAVRNQKIVQNKVWLDIFVEKADHRGDAVNVVDTICDAVKVAIDVDDRWFCIRRLDWSVNKDNPRIFIGITQENVEDSQVCSYCGRILPLRDFAKNKTLKGGHARTCKGCTRVSRKVEK